MKISLLAPAAALALASCASQNTYDTPGETAGLGAAYGSAPAAAAQPSYSDAIYNSQPAYADDAAAPAVATPPPVSQIPAAPPEPVYTPPAPQVAAAPRAPASAAPASGGTVHEVVRGDTLSGIAAKYKVSSASIKAANNMTSDTVVLGRKMVIPAR